MYRDPWSGSCLSVWWLKGHLHSPTHEYSRFGGRYSLPLIPSCWHPWSCPISFVGSIPHIGLPLVGNCAYILSGILRLLLCSANEAFHMMSSLAFDQYGGVMLSQVAGQGRGLPFPSVDAPFIFATCGSVWKTGCGQHWEESHSRNAVIMS